MKFLYLKVPNCNCGGTSCESKLERLYPVNQDKRIKKVSKCSNQPNSKRPSKLPPQRVKSEENCSQNISEKSVCPSKRPSKNVEESVPPQRANSQENCSLNPSEKSVRLSKKSENICKALVPVNEVSKKTNASIKTG